MLEGSSACRGARRQIFPGDPGVCLWLWSSRAASFPLLLQGPAQGDLPLPQVMLQAVFHLQILFLALQRFRWRIYWQAQCGALAFQTTAFAAAFRPLFPGEASSDTSGLSGQWCREQQASWATCCVDAAQELGSLS